MGFLAFQLRLFVLAVGRYTRIPAARSIDADAAEAAHAIRFYPAIGVFVGACCALVYAVAIRWFPPAVAVLFAMIAGLVVTGAMHERGFAYACDFWSGQRDAARPDAAPGRSRQSSPPDGGSAARPLGASGAIGVAMLLLLKFALLTYLDDFRVVVALLCGHALSRFAPLPVVWSCGKAGAADLGEGAEPAIGAGELLVAAIYGFLPLYLILRSIHYQPATGGPLLIGAGLALGATVAIGLRVRRERVGEQTLGAIQQVAEAAFYVGLLVAPR